MLVRLTQTGVYTPIFFLSSFFFKIQTFKFFAKFGPEKRIKYVSPLSTENGRGFVPTVRAPLMYWHTLKRTV